MHPTKHDLPEATRAKVVDMLNVALATAIDLSLAAKQAHWNVKGPHFFSLHALFDQVYDQAGDWSDDLAERAVQLGGTADGTLATVSTNSRLSKYPAAISGGRDHVVAVAERLAAFAAQTRAGIDAAAAAGDQVTSDLLNAVTAGVDKQLWMVEAHLLA
jgi:starvation-inducible DNA-binding protein